jgi:hypothetical protein
MNASSRGTVRRGTCRRIKVLLPMIAAGVLTAQVAAALGASSPSVTYTAALEDEGSYTVTDMAVDHQGNVWLTGSTTSHTLPVTDDAIDKVFAPDDYDEAFVLKFNAAGALVYATYLGGSLFDGTGGLAIDDDGNVFIAGVTLSPDFPVTLGAYQSQLASPGAEDAFLVKLDPAGHLLASTYFGGNSRDLFPGGVRGFPAAAVALGGDGTVYLASGTNSTDLPTNDGYQPQYGGGTQDVFLATFTSNLSFVRCTYLGGDNNEGAYRAAVDGSGNVVLLGAAARYYGQPWTFPVTSGAYQTAPSGDPLMFVVKFDAGGGLVYATFLGPDTGDNSLFDYHGDLAVDPAGNAYIVGVTAAAAFPVTPGAFQTTRRGFSDLFVSKLDPTGAHLVYSTLFGGSAAEYSNDDVGVRIAVNDQGNAYIAGHTDSLDLPEKDAFEATRTGRFIAKLNAAGSDLAYASYLPAANFGADALALDNAVRANATAYLGGPTVNPRGVAAFGIGEGGAAACAGDCDGDGVVRANELVLGVRDFLSQASPPTCSSLDENQDGAVDEAELLKVIPALFGDCG